VTCAFAPGTLTAIVGPNGAGKTTYFNLISGQLGPRAARALNGRDLTGLAPSARTRPAGAGLPAHQSVSQPVGAGERAPGRAGHAGRAQALNLWSIWSDHRD
jgi:branched-chain amino acid transport system ATP-binding protein